jgi:DNA-directed RNA polymerase specialized sigma24 family protein
MLAGPLLLIAARLAPAEPEAREAVRAAFVRVFDGNCTWDTLAELRGLLRQTVIDIAVGASPSSDCSEESIESLLPRFTEDGHHASDRSEIDGALWRAAPATDHALIRSYIARLPLIHRRVLILIDVERLSRADVAQLLSTTPADVRRRLHEARQALTAMLSASHPVHRGMVMDRQDERTPVVCAE